MTSLISGDDVKGSFYAQVTEEEYNSFFKATFKEFLEPAAHTHFNVEGTIEFSALLYIPGMAPFEEQARSCSPWKRLQTRSIWHFHHAGNGANHIINY